jgi:hypothetical protein
MTTKDRIKPWAKGYGLLLVIWVFAPYFRLPLFFLTLGCSLNVLVEVANGGRMPVRNCFRPKDRRHASWDGAKLRPLCDIIETPWGFASLGDAIIFGGLGLMAIQIVGRSFG